MYCKNCGVKLEGENFCQNCGNSLVPNQTPVVAQQVEIKDNTADILCTISVCLYFGMPLLSTLLCIIGLAPLAYIISPFSRIAAYVLMIIARVKYPESKFAKILMWIYIALFAVSIVLAIILTIACGVSLVWCIAELEKLGEIGMIWR